MHTKNRVQRLLASLLALTVFVGSTATSFASTSFEPYQETFIISAYYSPLPDQAVYFRGSYDADRRLNGNGTNGADGTQVYPGMLAAPKSYLFGTKLKIPGLGVGTIHDRGGAIVEAGVRTNEHDRIDVWMGAGEEGLARALNWGMRTVTATVYPPHHELADSFTLPTNLASLNHLKKLPFPKNIGTGDSGDLVKSLQAELKTLGYYRGAEHGDFDAATEAAVLKYQFARRIVSEDTDPGAGYVGPATRTALNKDINNRGGKKISPTSLLATSILQSGGASPALGSNRFPVTLSKGDSGDRVRDMQIALAKLGMYECDINGIYDERAEVCVLKFQEENEIVQAGQLGAGTFGPQTSQKLASVLTTAENKQNERIASSLPAGTATPGDTNETVTRMQTGLAKMGHYAGEINGNYDTATRSALTQFQVATGIIETETSYGAGHFGPKTKTLFISKYRENLLATIKLPSNPSWDRKVQVAYQPIFSQTLSLGDSSDTVRELQETLKKLGHFDAEPTGTFGDKTRAALVKFQLENNIVADAASYGAGILGPRTRAALNATVAREKVALMKFETA